ncbi:amyloid-beta A4 precursor protein-binding family A member 2-like isoform X8 [Agrilus planipennis]|uniref:Amyloid-beta A4 precursor protein-binding family A member 2-like isoform X8 n=1 Tax=Agrilus planipennis TaxID=224129 RepID=A0A1W4WZT1_AGRPL|nr:amyloid-beta A4 precursor protein-binding family A member 2-like isoform X8 [Agrilus planipennis]
MTTSITLALDNVDVSENTEQISKLFPKCRPRSDINLNPVIAAIREHDIDNEKPPAMNIEKSNNDRWEEPSNDSKETETHTRLSENEDELIESENLEPLHNKLHDPRIIEIAGGREIYSQSRSKAVRKSRNSNNFNDESEKKKCQKSPIGHGVWELRSHCDELKKVKNNKQFTETVFSSEVSSISQNSTVTENEKNNAAPNIKYPGDVVVFDDIEDQWNQDRYKSVTKYPEVNHSDNSVKTKLEKATTMIGNLPIAVYEGSPKRYGPRHVETNSHPQLPSAQSLLASPSVCLPRPGFPQRVITTTSDSPETNITIETSVASRKSQPLPPQPTTASTFDYLYEFSETRKVLEEFFKCQPEENRLETEFQDLEYELRRPQDTSGSSYVGQRLAKGRRDHMEFPFTVTSPNKYPITGHQEYEATEHDNNFLDLSVGTGSSEDLGETEVGLQVGQSRNFTLSPETTDCDSNCGDLDSEVSLMVMENEIVPSVGLLGSNGNISMTNDSSRLCSSMPVLEDGLSSGHASDTDNNNPGVISKKHHDADISKSSNGKQVTTVNGSENGISLPKELISVSPINLNNCKGGFEEILSHMDSHSEKTPPPPAPAPYRCLSGEKGEDVEAAIRDIRLTLQRTKTLPANYYGEEPDETNNVSPVWVPRQRGVSGVSIDSDRKVQSGEEGGDEEEADTDLETDRLLGQQRTDDQGFYDDKGWRKPKSRTILPPHCLSTPNHMHALNEGVMPLISPDSQNSRPSSPTATSDKSRSPQSQKGSTASVKLKKEKDIKKKGRNKEDTFDHSVLIEGVLFRARYLGSTQLVCEGQPTKTTRMMQAEEAVSRIKAPDGESQPSTEVDLFISTEKIMVLNTDLKEIMMDHALRTISYIADIGDLVVLMARRRFVPHEMEEAPKINRTPKMICHVFESEEAQFIAQSIGQAFQVAYMEFLKANGIEDHSFVKEMDYQEVLNSQEIFGDELQMFAKKEMQKEVVVPKTKGEILGVVIVESGWGSMLPTVVIANLAPAGAAARCGQLNIGDQIIAINGISLVGLPLSTCQNYIKNSKNQTVVKLTVVPCAPVVEVKIKRPDTKYQLGFSVQNGVICSLLRGGIAERGGVRVGHRIIEINNQSVVAVPHEKIVNLLATSIGEILMKTMPTSMFRLLTGQENPVYI